jgi:hypothetical protein
MGLLLIQKSWIVSGKNRQSPTNTNSSFLHILGVYIDWQHSIPMFSWIPQNF